MFGMISSCMQYDCLFLHSWHKRLIISKMTLTIQYSVHLWNNIDYICSLFSIISLSSLCQFHQRFCARVFRTNVVSAAFLVTCTVEKAAEMTFVQKICTFTADEIDSLSFIAVQISQLKTKAKENLFSMTLISYVRTN